MTTRQTARPYVTCWTDGTTRSAVDLSSITAAFSASKSIAAPSGRFSITLQPTLRQPWFGGFQGPRNIATPSDLERLLRPQSVVSLGMDEPGGIMFGLVDSVQANRNFAGERVDGVVTIQGQDFGKILTNDHIVHASITTEDSPRFLVSLEKGVGPQHALLQNIRGSWGPTTRDNVVSFLQKDVADVARWILEVGPSMTVPMLRGLGGQGWAGGPSDKASTFIRPDVTTGWNDGRIQSEQPFDFQGTYWDFLRSVLDADFYELWIDSTPNGTPVPDVFLVIRPKPFDEPGLDFLTTTETPRLTWQNLLTRTSGAAHRIPIGEVLTEQMGISDADVFSYYLVTSQYDAMGTPAASEVGQYYPAVDVYALRRHGLRAYDARLTLMASADFDKRLNNETQTRKIGSEAWEFRNRLFNWYRLAPWFESGSLTVAGRDKYRVGEPVEIPWKMPIRGAAAGTRSYCVATEHAWTFGDTYTTTLNLTRGHNASVIAAARAEIDAEARALGVENAMAVTGAGAAPYSPPSLQAPGQVGLVPR